MIVLSKWFTCDLMLSKYEITDFVWIRTLCVLLELKHLYCWPVYNRMGVLISGALMGCFYNGMGVLISGALRGGFYNGMGVLISGALKWCFYNIEYGCSHFRSSKGVFL